MELHFSDTFIKACSAAHWPFRKSFSQYLTGTSIPFENAATKLGARKSRSNSEILNPLLARITVKFVAITVFPVPPRDEWTDIASAFIFCARLKDLRDPLKFIAKNWRDPLTPAMMRLSCEAVGGRLEETHEAALAMSLMSLSVCIWGDNRQSCAQAI